MKSKQTHTLREGLTGAQSGGLEDMDTFLRNERVNQIVRKIVNELCSDTHGCWLPYYKSAEDLGQDVLLRIAEKLSRAGEFESDEGFEAWVRKLAKNIYYDGHRKRDPMSKGMRLDIHDDERPEQGSINLEEILFIQPSQLEELIAKEYSQVEELLPEALSRLTDLERQCVIAWAEGAPYARIAELMGLKYPEQAKRKLISLFLLLNKALRELEKRK